MFAGYSLLLPVRLELGLRYRVKMRNIATHWLFAVLIVVFVIMAILNVLPFPILAILLLVSWCLLAVVVLLVQRILSKNQTKN